MLIDTHCHLGDPKFALDRREVVARAAENGVGHMIVVADSVDTSRQAAAIAAEHKLSATAGVHPHEAKSWTDETGPELRELLRMQEVVAVGEAGLDYHYNYSSPDQQRVAFLNQLELAEELSLPIVVHSRSADEDMAAMIRDSRATLVLHSFSSGRAVLEAALERDAYISFSGMVTFKSWTDTEAVAVPPDTRILVETDAPYLAPVPYRGRRNEPGYVVEVARRVAELRGMSFHHIASQTTDNAKRCFDLELHGRTS